MHLYLCRHGMAEGARSGRSNRERELTRQGRVNMAREAAVLKRIGWDIEHVFTSPLVRAQQTAGILAPAFDLEPEPEPLLQLGCSPNDVEEVLGRHERLHHVMIVGHQPDLSAIIEHLTGHRLSIRPGGVAVVETDLFRAGLGHLVGFYDPDVLARLGESYE